MTRRILSELLAWGLLVLVAAVITAMAVAAGPETHDAPLRGSRVLVPR